MVFKNAMQIAIDAYRKFSYSHTIRCNFLREAHNLEEYLVSYGFEYSSEAVKTWLELPNSNRGKYKTAAIIEDIMQNGASTLILSKQDRFQYKYLPEWIRKIVDGYLYSLSMGPSRTRVIRNDCSFFSHFLVHNGIVDLEQLTDDVIEKFFQLADEKKPEITSLVCKKVILKFLQYAENHNLIFEYNWSSIKTSYIEPLLVPLSEDERSRISSILCNETTILIEQWVASAEEYISLMEKSGYTKGWLSSARKAIQKFKHFLEVNDFTYETHLADEWLKRNQKEWSHNQYLSNRRTLLQIDELLNIGEVRTTFFVEHKPEIIPEWCFPVWNEYIELRSKEAPARSTMFMIKNSCKRFFGYLNSHEIHSWTEITPWNIKDFHDHDEHSTAEGRNAYASRVRMFLEFLADKELIPKTLPFALLSVSAPKSRIITILNDEQIQMIYSYRSQSKTASELRVSAMAMLGLCLGMRSIDIVGLHLQDISWEVNEIFFIQQKTGKPLALPLPVDVGNSLYRYIENGRPFKASTDKVFTAHRAPYGQLNREACWRCMYSVFGKEIAKALGGFHITRRTQASKLLTAENNIHTIATALGHSQTKTIERYLSTDEEHMRLCTINLEGIEYKGKWRS